MRNHVMGWLLAGLCCACLTTHALGAEAPTSREYMGDFILNREIPVNLAAGTAEHPKLVEIPWARIEPVYGNAWVLTARIGWLPVVDATWQVRVELLDDKGGVLRHSRDLPTTFTAKAAANPNGMQYAEIELGAMHWEMRRHAAKVRVILESAEDPTAIASSDPSANFGLVVFAADGKSDKPLADAAVVARASYDDGQYRAQIFLQQTDARGECRIGSAKAALRGVSVTIQKQGYATLAKSWSAPYSAGVSGVPLVELPERHAMKMPPSQTIGGIVQDQAGRPVAAAMLRVEAHLQETSGAAWVNRCVQTDEQGRWQIGRIPCEADTVSLRFRHLGYINDQWSERHATPEESDALHDLRHVMTLKKGLTVKGRVLDDRGRPVPSAAVVLAPADGASFDYDYACTLTDASGEFRFGCARNDLTEDNPEGGSTGVLVEIPGYVPALKRVIVEPNLAPLEFRLSPGRSVTVRVIDGNDRPIAGADTVANALTEDRRYGFWLPNTDEQGRVLIPNAPDGEILFTAFKSGYVTVRDNALPASSDQHVVKMRPAPRIQGMVRDARTGELIGDFAVGAVNMTGGRARSGEPVRFKGGRFEMAFSEGTPETLQLRILAAGYKPLTSQSIRLEGTRVLEFKLDADPSFDARALQQELGGPERSEPLVVTGTVMDPNGQPVPGALVNLFPLGGLEATSDANGRFKLRCPGRMGMSMERTPPYFLVRTRERNLAVVMEFDPKVTENVAVKLDPAIILSGKIVDEQGKGIAGTKLSLIFWPGQMGYGMREEPDGPDPNGRYEIRAIPAGYRYSVDASAEGYGRDQVQALAGETEGDRMELETIVLKPANMEIGGVVVDTEDKPVPAANVSLYGRGQSNQRVKTDAQGRFQLRGVCAGPARIQASVSGQARQFGDIQTEGGAIDVKIVISPTGSRGQYVPAKPPSLVGKTLPDLADLCLESAADATKDRSILLCFFDMNQRPSRHCLTQIAGQADALRNEGVVVVAAQAGEAETGALAAWLEEQGIAVPVGSIGADVKKTTFAWGVQSLPWLILTDGKHTVMAEGFGVDELDTKVKSLAGANQ